MKLVINTDGGARGNPGPAGIGYIIQNREGRIFENTKYIGEKTNNQAEYIAVVEALKWIKGNFLPNRTSELSDMVEIECLLDSQLIVEQLNLRYKLKNEGLKPLFWEIRELVMQLGGRVSFKYIPREENYLADKLVNKAIDEAIK